MRGISILTLVAVSTMIHPSFADADDLHAFDLSRFSSDLSSDLSAQDRNRPRDSYSPAKERVEYTFDADGRLARGASSQVTADVLNNYSLSFGRSDSANPGLTSSVSITSRPLESDKKGNANPVAEANAKCGPSPLAPIEIEALISQIAGRYGVDIGFAKAIAWTESRFDRIRNSPKGARGPMQLIPETAERFGVTDICDPASNIEGGVRYIRSLIDEFGNPLLVAAAYNAGEQPIYDHGGIPPFAETVGYVAAVVNYQLGLDAPQRRGSTQYRPPHPFAQAKTEGTNTVIGTTGNAKFVGGVMQF